VPAGFILASVEAFKACWPCPATRNMSRPTPRLSRRRDWRLQCARLRTASSLPRRCRWCTAHAAAVSRDKALPRS